MTEYVGRITLIFDLFGGKMKKTLNKDFLASELRSQGQAKRKPAGLLSVGESQTGFLSWLILPK